MNAQFEIPQQALTEAMAESLFKGELGEKVADRLAGLYAEITTYNRTDAAKLLNIGRSTLYEYENGGLITFRSDGRISLAALLKFQRDLSAEESEDDSENEIKRKTRKEKRRKF